MTDLFGGIDPQERVPRPDSEPRQRGRSRGKSAELDLVLEQLRSAPGIRSNLTCWREYPARAAVYADWPETLDARLIAALAERGIERPYSHQADAIRAILEKRNVCVVTPTASGKTLCYNVPVIQSILETPSARALYMFPTKALSHDQYRELYDLTQILKVPIKTYTFDGDTPASARKALRNAGQIIVTNPDMLHTGVLPHHTLWMKLFENLRYVVVDEIHNYRGVFGSHVGNVFRRLRRICRFYGSHPVFICCSATIANPRELAESLLEEPVELMDRNGAPSGRKVFVFYNPPVVNEELGIRSSVKNEARRLAIRFLSRGIQTILFARSRLLVEVIATYLRRAMEKLHRSPESIAAYRSGYLPRERRAIEEGIKSGRLLGVVSTNALELGIDIGSLDVAILAGWPGSVASAWQQGGRAGRKSGTSAVFLIANSSPLDQFLMNHPDYFFGSPPEQGIVNPDNLGILTNHLKCACFELPFEEEETFGSARVTPILQHLDEEHVVRHTGGRWYYSEDSYPAEEISLRSATAENFIVLNTADRNRVIAEVDYDSAPFLIHEDAIYLHQGQQYVVDRLDWDGRAAYVRPVVVDYYTDPEASTNIQVLTVDQCLEFGIGSEEALAGRGLESGAADGGAEAGGVEPKIIPAWVPSPMGPLKLPSAPLRSKNFGDVSVATVVAKFKKVQFETHESIGYGTIHVPQNETQTEAYWLSFREDLREELEKRSLDLAAGLRGLANLLRNLIPIYVLCDPRDFNAWPMLRAPYDQRPTIYVYDRYPGGIGIARRLFSLDAKILDAAREVVRTCSCREGCPSCVGPRLEAGESARATTHLLLEALRRQG